MEKEDSTEKNLKLIAKTSFIVLIGLILSKVLAYVYKVIIARYFGPDVYGLFSLAFTASSLFLAIASFGLSEGLLRYIPQYRAKNKTDKIRYIFKLTVKFSMISGIIASLVLFFMAKFISVSIFHDPRLIIFIQIFSLLITISLITNIFLMLLRGFEEIAWYSFINNILQNLIRVGLLIILIFLGISSGGDIVAWSYVLGALLVLLITYIISRYKLHQIFGDYKIKDKKLVRSEIVSYSWPLMFYSVIAIIFVWVDSFSIGYYKSAAEVGIYNASVSIALLLGLVPEIFMQLFFPLINREYSKKNYFLIEQLSKQVAKWIFLINLPLFILLFFFPGAALNILFGNQYLGAENSLRLLIISSFISSLAAVSIQLISVKGKSKLILMNIVIGTVLNIILNSFLVPMNSIFSIDNSSGLVGAAAATLISVTVINILFFLQTKKYFSFIPLRRKMLTISLIAIIPTLTLFYLKNMIKSTLFSVLLVSASFFILYSLLVLVSGALDKNDLMIIKSTLRKVFKGLKN